MTKIVGSTKIGSKISLSLSRDGKIIKVKMVLHEKEEYVRMQGDLDNMFRSYGIEVDENAETGDVVVAYVAPDKSYTDLEQGDIISGINGERISGIDDFIGNFRNSDGEIKTLDVTRHSEIYEVRFDENE